MKWALTLVDLERLARSSVERLRKGIDDCTSKW